jgi:hypothetical protein
MKPWPPFTFTPIAIHREYLDQAIRALKLRLVGGAPTGDIHDRAVFEYWWLREVVHADLSVNSINEYTDQRTRDAWMGYQAARSLS